MDKYLIDSHKLIYHPERVAALKDAGRDWEKHKKLRPIYAEISTSGACNHRCTFCSVDYIGYKSVFLSREVLKSFYISAAKIGLKSVMFAGDGEPLLNPEINEIVKDAADQNIDTSFTTNGVHINDKFINESLNKVSWIKVSLNAGTKESYERIHRTNIKDFDKVWENVEKCISHRQKGGCKTTFGVQSLILPDNIDTLGELAERARDKGMDYLVLKPYVHNRYMKQEGYEDIDYTSKLYRETIHNVKQNHETESFKIISRENALSKLIGQVERYTTCWSTPALWFYISGNGSVYACGAHVGNPMFELGNINNKLMEEIWESKKEACLNYVQDELKLDTCRRTCRMDEVNAYLYKIIEENLIMLFHLK